MACLLNQRGASMLKARNARLFFCSANKKAIDYQLTSFTGQPVVTMLRSPPVDNDVLAIIAAQGEGYFQD